MQTEVYLALGSNLGDKVLNLENAIKRLKDIGNGLEVSSFHQTIPWGYSRQPLYLNAVCKFWTKLGLFELHRITRRIENDVQATKPFQNAPRLIDLDILLYGRLVIDVPGLVVPHPRMAVRDFVLEPLVEIAPNLQHPVMKCTVISILTKLRNENLLSVSHPM